MANDEGGSGRAPRIARLVAALPVSVPFVGPEHLARARGRPFKARLGANESIFGPSPRALAVMREAAAGSWMYADPESYDLRVAIARHHGVSPDNVVVGEGIDGLLGHACKIVLDEGSVVVTSDGAYPTFNFHVAANGGRLVKVPYRADREDIPALLERARAEDARILYVSNPDNPMGSWWPAEDVARLVTQLPPGVLLLLDEAYGDTAPAGTLPSIDAADPRVLRFRTFSKAYGLAGARIGYAIGEPCLIATFEKVRNHYGINRVGQLGALTALEDQAYLAEVVARIARARDRIGDIARENGLIPLPSATNFVAIDCGGDGAFAGRVLSGLIERDIFARKPMAAGLDRCIRVSCGTDAQLDILAAELPAAVAAARR